MPRKGNGLLSNCNLRHNSCGLGMQTIEGEMLNTSPTWVSQRKQSALNSNNVKFCYYLYQKCSLAYNKYYKIYCHIEIHDGL